MLFATTNPDSQGDRVLLYFDPTRARAEARDGRTIFGVVADLDASRRRVAAPDGSAGLDLPWSAPAYLEGFDRVVARGPIPVALVLEQPGCCRRP